MKKNILFVTILFTQIAFAQDIHLLCDAKDPPHQMSFSITREKGKLIVRQNSVTIRDREYDKEGGYSKIQETPTQFRIEYEQTSKDFECLGVLNRLNGVFVEECKRNGTVTTSTDYACKPVKRLF